VAALTPKAELEEMGDSLPGLQARLMSQALRKLTATIKKRQLYGHLHQPIRMKIGVMMFGSPRPPPAATRSFYAWCGWTFAVRHHQAW
jgi:recombination protein RecA